jgi:pimeloyl-ACP methyl ester carboxylesterase
MPLAKLPTGVELYYETHGSGEPLLLIPSTAFGSSVWQPFQVPGLSKHLQLIIFDPRGTGESSKPQDFYTIEHMAADVVALLDFLQLPSAHLLGHSMGGRIALQAALDWPGRVRSLIMAASGSGAAAREGHAIYPGVTLGLVDSLVRNGLEGHVRHEITEGETFFTNDYRASHEAEVREFFDLAWKGHARWPDYLRLVMARQNWEATHRLGDLTVPTLVACGDRDTEGSNHLRQAEVMRDSIPGAEFKLLAGQSHGFFWQAPDETNEWIREWVLRHRPSEARAAGKV